MVQGLVTFRLSLALSRPKGSKPVVSLSLSLSLSLPLSHTHTHLGEEVAARARALVDQVPHERLHPPVEPDLPSRSYMERLPI